MSAWLPKIKIKVVVRNETPQLVLTRPGCAAVDSVGA